MICPIIKNISGHLCRFCGLPVAVFSKVEHYLEEATGQLRILHTFSWDHITAVIYDWQRLPHLGQWSPAFMLSSVTARFQGHSVSRHALGAPG